MITITEETRYDNSRMGDVIVTHDDGRRVASGLTLDDATALAMGNAACAS